ncbi:hypothetical protein ACJRO7_019541 [Eucalyptus globulus]|uniref:Prokaryotic-type class I peptide chain release factors domain-containing protein n=1 Tax=Eucalyptus globulus TaxID=34317 RepID=A0ABD3KIA5_EUCGL
MAAIRATTAMVLREMFAPLPAVRRIRPPLPCLGAALLPAQRGISFTPIRCAAQGGAGEKKAPSRLAQVQQLLREAEERALSAGGEPTPEITLDHVTVSFARSGGPGGQNVNKVNTKVDMRFNVNNAYWLSDRIRERIMQMEKNRINKDGEIVISSTKTRTQKSLSSLVCLNFLGFAA